MVKCWLLMSCHLTVVLWGRYHLVVASSCGVLADCGMLGGFGIWCAVWLWGVDRMGVSLSCCEVLGGYEVGIGWL